MGIFKRIKDLEEERLALNLRVNELEGKILSFYSSLHTLQNASTADMNAIHDELKALSDKISGEEETEDEKTAREKFEKGLENLFRF